MTWTTAGTATISITLPVTAGLVVTSHNDSSTATGTFLNYSATAEVTSAAAQTLARRYVYGSYVDEPLALVTPSATSYYASNRVYSVVALTDSSGAVAERYRYDTYGRQTVLDPTSTTIRSASSYGNQLGFTGRYLDGETGLWYFRARYESPTLGRFISRDVFEYVDGFNLYEPYFVPNEIDPAGNVCCKPKTGGAAYAYAGNRGNCPSDADKVADSCCPKSTKKCRIQVKVWYIRQTLWIGRHGFIETNCDGDDHTFELEDTIFFDPKNVKNPWGNGLGAPHSLPDASGSHQRSSFAI